MNQVSLNAKTFSKVNFYSIRLVVYSFWLEIVPQQKSKKLVRFRMFNLSLFGAVSKVYSSVLLRIFFVRWLLM